jgi:hypothetical protein
MPEKPIVLGVDLDGVVRISMPRCGRSRRNGLSAPFISFLRRSATDCQSGASRPQIAGEAGEPINSSPFAPDLCNPAIFRG